VEASVSSGENTRASEWTQSIAVGSKDFVEGTKLRLCIHAQERKVSETESAYQLREPQASYSDDFSPEKEALRFENTHFCNTHPNISRP
jgi:putative transposase